jgi:hypothetical protein
MDANWDAIDEGHMTRTACFVPENPVAHPTGRKYMSLTDNQRAALRIWPRVSRPGPKMGCARVVFIAAAAWHEPS